MDTTVVQLGPSESDASVISFQEAFGEFSEAAGRFKQKQHARKMQNIAQKTERNVAKAQGRTLIRTTKVAGRGQVQSGRQANKMGRVGFRQGKKMTKRTGRFQRRAIGQEPQETGMSQTEYQENGIPQSNAPVYEEPQQEQYSPEPAAEQEPVYQQEEATQEEAPAYQPEESVDQESTNDEMQAGTDETISEDESSFNGEASEGAINVPGKVQDNANRIEWNKEAILRLNVREHNIKMALQNYMPQLQKKALAEELRAIPEQREKHLKRIAYLEQNFSNYSNADGGKHAKLRHKQIGKAKGIALKSRMDMHAALKNKAKVNAEMNRNRVKKHGGSETPVDPELNPKLASQKIVIPSSNATGQTGSIAIDDHNNYGADPDTVIELQSNFGGVQNDKAGTVKTVVVGALIGLGIIFAYNYLSNKSLKEAKF